MQEVGALRAEPSGQILFLSSKASCPRSFDLATLWVSCNLGAVPLQMMLAGILT